MACSASISPRLRRSRISDRVGWGLASTNSKLLAMRVSRDVFFGEPDFLHDDRLALGKLGEFLPVGSGLGWGDHTFACRKSEKNQLIRSNYKQTEYYVKK